MLAAVVAAAPVAPLLMLGSATTAAETVVVPHMEDLQMAVKVPVPEAGEGARLTLLAETEAQG